MRGYVRLEMMRALLMHGVHKAMARVTGAGRLHSKFKFEVKENLIGSRAKSTQFYFLKYLE